MPQLVYWSDEARADVRAMDRETALRLLKSLARFVETESGSVKQMEGYDPPRYRLRVGDWRIIFQNCGGGAIEVIRVRHRGEAYR